MGKIFGRTKPKAVPAEEKAIRQPEADSRNMSPFIAGMNEYMERYGSLVNIASTWRRISFILSLLCVLCVLSVIFTSKSVKTVPFIVQVDRHGYEIAIKPVEASGIDDRLIISRLGRFITNIRTVLNDDVAQLVYIDFVYKSVPNGSAAYKKVIDFYQKNNPLLIAEKGKTAIFVELKSILPLGNSGKTWRGEWEEKRMNVGSLVSVKSFTGIFEIEVSPPSAIKDIMENPLGLFVTDFNVTEELKNK
jgi:type IV secretion system protein VirB5